MKYYKDIHNNIYADPVDLTGLVEIETPIFNNKVLKGHKNISQVETKEDGSYYTYYNEDFAVDMVEEDRAQTIIDAKDIKDTKQIELDSLVVEANTIPFDGDIQSIGYMSSVLALANFKMIQAVSAGATMEDTYDGIYKSIINWKNANDSVSEVQLETVAEALEKAMLAIATIKTT